MSDSYAYREALEQLQVLKSKPLPLEVQHAAQNAMENELAKPETMRNYLKEVKHLVNNVIKIDQAFERVKTDVGKIDNSNIIGKPVEKLQPRWMGFQQRFAALLWDSRKTARQTGAYVRGTITPNLGLFTDVLMRVAEFLNVILPELEEVRSQADYRSAAADLKEFIARKDPFAGKFDSKEAVNPAQRQSQAFINLRRDMTTFKDDLDIFTEEQDVELCDDIILLYGVINKLNLEIERCEMMVLAIGTAVGVTSPVAVSGSVASLAALSLVGPATTLEIFFSGTAVPLAEFKSLISFASNTNEHKDGLSSAHIQVNDLKAQARALERIQATLKIQEAGITDTCGRIDRLAMIWSYVAHDAGLIAADLKDVVRCAEGAISRKAFLTRLNLVRRTYGALATVLKEYATQMDGHSFRFGQTDPR